MRYGAVIHAAANDPTSGTSELPNTGFEFGASYANPERGQVHLVKYGSESEVARVSDRGEYGLGQGCAMDSP